MPISKETLNSKLFKVLSKYDPTPLDATGKVTPMEDEADVFKFKFTKDGEEYGDVFATVDDDRQIILYYKDDVTQSPESPTDGLGYNDTWSGFLEQLARWWPSNGFDGRILKDMSKLGTDMAKRKHMKNKDQLGEGYYPMGKKASYSDAVPTVKIVIEHSRVIEEGEQRYRNINRIFLENQEGERYLLDTKKPGIARVYARHIAEGGKVNDDRWNHVHSLCEEYSKMAGFVRATRNGQFNESAQSLVNEGIAHYQSLRESLSRMTGKRGYNAYFESWTPALMEDEGDETNLNELFVQETLDPRIESVMPILNRIHKKVGESVVDKQLSKLEEWADSLTEDESLTSNNPVGIPESEGRQEIGQMMADDGITYSAEKENEIISKMVEYMKKSGMDSKQIRYLLNYSEDYIADQLSYLPKEGMDESALQAYLGDKKYGKDGMDALRDAGRKHVGKAKMQKIRAKFSNKEEEVDENFINTDAQAVVSEEDAMAEGILDSIKNMFKPKDPTPVTPVTSVDIVTGYKTDPEFKAQIDQIAKQQGMTPQALIAHIKQGLDAGADVIGVGEGTHTQHDRDLNPNDYDRDQTDFSRDPIAAGTDRIHDKIKSMLGRLKKPASSPLDKRDTDIGSVLDEMDKSQTPPGRDGDPRPGPERVATPITKEKMVKHALDTLTKSMDKKDDKKDVKEGQDDLDAILRIIRK